jgi:hypothetical protein
VTAESYRTRVLDGVLRYSPAEHVRRPSVPAESPTPGVHPPVVRGPAHRRLGISQPVRLRAARHARPADLRRRQFGHHRPGEKHGHQVQRAAARVPRSSYSRCRPAVGRGHRSGKLEFSVKQVKALHQYYSSRPQPDPPSLRHARRPQVIMACALNACAQMAICSYAVVAMGAQLTLRNASQDRVFRNWCRRRWPRLSRRAESAVWSTSLEAGLAPGSGGL